jgi:hypothetical protein
MRRVLHEGGRAALSVYSPIERSDARGRQVQLPARGLRRPRSECLLTRLARCEALTSPLGARSRYENPRAPCRNAA